MICLLFRPSCGVAELVPPRTPRIYGSGHGGAMIAAPEEMTETPDRGGRADGRLVGCTAGRAFERRRVSAGRVHGAVVHGRARDARVLRAVPRAAPRTSFPITTWSRASSASLSRAGAAAARQRRTRAVSAKRRPSDGHDLGLPPVDGRDIIVPAAHGLHSIRHGGGGAPTKLICGYLGCEPRGQPGHLDPARLDDAQSRRNRTGRMDPLDLSICRQRSGCGAAGSDTVLAKLSELLFVEAVRRYVNELPADQTGWLAGLRDPVVARALALMHGDIARPLERRGTRPRRACRARCWPKIHPPDRDGARCTISCTGACRSAAQKLRETSASLAQVAELVGYEIRGRVLAGVQEEVRPRACGMAARCPVGVPGRLALGCPNKNDWEETMYWEGRFRRHWCPAPARASRRWPRTVR